MKNQNASLAFSIVVLLAALMVAIVAGCVWGAADISAGDMARIIMSKLPWIGKSMGEIPAGIESIIWQLRLPRVILAAIVGGSLAGAGVVFQGVFRNPMADPYLLGTSAGASLGGAVAILLGIGFSLPGVSGTGVMAFLGGIGAVFLVYGIARTRGRISTATLLLSGIAVSAFLTAVISLLLLFHRENMQRVVFWTMGGLGGARWGSVLSVAPGMLIALVIIACSSRELNILLTGDETAAHLGVAVARVKRRMLVVGALLAGLAVSVSGIIGFVGLIVPHMVRLVVGPDHRRLLPVSFLGGAVFLVIADLLARSLIPPMEIPVGIVTALFGAPFFLFLLIRRKREVG
jgi:iron complex transport system permease protein